jgi:hypothetical protein
VVRLLPTAPTRTPPANTIQFVRTSAADDREINAALVSRPSVQRALGGGGVIAPLPGILRQVTETGEVVQLKAIAGRGLPLVYDRARRLFRGTILLGVEDVAGQQRPLSVPVLFQVLNADSADPMDTSFDHTSPPYKVVSVTLSAVRPVRVLSALIPDGGVDVALQLSPTLEIEAGHGALEGFGLEATQVNISLSGVPRLRGRAVTLHTDAGYVEPTLVRLDDQGNASVMLRSGSPGTAHIRASTPGIEPADTTVYFRLPWPTVLASLFGGIVGGFVAGRRKRALAVAVAWGLLGWICYTAGINFSSYTPSVTVGLAVVVAMSFIFAIIGSAILAHPQQ